MSQSPSKDDSRELFAATPRILYIVLYLLPNTCTYINVFTIKIQYSFKRCIVHNSEQYAPSQKLFSYWRMSTNQTDQTIKLDVEIQPVRHMAVLAKWLSNDHRTGWKMTAAKWLFCEFPKKNYFY